MKVAIIHYWLVNMRGGEKVLELLCDIFPQADIYTLVIDKMKISNIIKSHKIKPSFIQKMPLSVKNYQKYLPLHPFAIEQFDLSPYDLIISSESGVAKGVISSPNTCHICYCHTPMRYLWNMYHEYRRDLNAVNKIIWMFVSNYMRQWDYSNAQRVDYYIANSINVQKRIKKYYNRKSEVIYPPVDFKRFKNKTAEDFYLFVGQLNPYKKADLAVKAFNKSDKKLIVIGDGPELGRLKKNSNNNITILGKQPFDTLVNFYSRCKALIFPGEEDFGITPLEAMASGKPVIAYGKGGALETIINGKTGLFFDHQHEDDLLNAIKKADDIKWDTEFIRSHAKKFDKQITLNKLKESIISKYEEFSDNNLRHNNQV